MSNRLEGPIGRMLEGVAASWAPVVRAWRATAEGKGLEAFIAARLAAGATIYPAAPLRALEATPRHHVKVVILGQDPYHGPGQAEGLAFSVPVGQRIPPSLRNVFEELRRDLNLPVPTHGHLGAWARRGVLLLNTALTVEDGQPGAHTKRGWEALTDALIESVADDPSPKVFMLWGAHAQAKAERAERAGHLALKANHPSPLSARRGPIPFLGCGHFGAANRLLVSAGRAPVDWSLD